MTQTTHRTATFTLLAALALTSITTSSAATAPRASAAALRRGVVAALDANHSLAARVLWTNRAPASATQSTRGPALTAMRVSAAGRAQQKLRVRVLHDQFRILSIRIDRAHASATAVVQSIQLLLPSAPDGKPLGRPVSLNERAQINLRQLRPSSRFVVWTIALLP